MRKRGFINGMICVLLIFSTPVVEGQGNSPGSAIEPNLAGEAMEILKGSTRFIEATEAFSVSGHAAGELMMEDGQLVEYGTAFKITFVRPAKLHLYMNARDGINTRLIFDGKTITVAVNTDGQNIFDKTPQHGDVHESLDFVASYSGSSREIASFLTRQLTQSLSTMQSGLSLGKSTIDGVVCDHLVLRSENRDGQVWIARGDEPTPRRMLITHRNKLEKPRFWIQFDEWDLSPEISEATFNYLPPEGAEKVDYFQE